MSKEDNKEEAPEQEQSIWRSLGGTLLYLLVIVLLTWVIVTFVGQRTKVDGHSMEPTLSDGDNLIVDKLSYRFRDPERYDIIVFPYQHAENTYYIKRIIGLPGETVQVIDGYMYINGKKLDEHYFIHSNATFPPCTFQCCCPCHHQCIYTIQILISYKSRTRIPHFRI